MSMQQMRVLDGGPPSAMVRKIAWVLVGGWAVLKVLPALLGWFTGR